MNSMKWSNITIFEQRFDSDPYHAYKTSNFPNLKVTNENLKCEWLTGSLDDNIENLNKNLLVLNLLPLQQGMPTCQNELVLTMQRLP